MQFKFSASKELESKILEHLKIQGLICTNIGIKNDPDASHHHIRNITNDPGVLELSAFPIVDSNEADYVLEMREDRVAEWGQEAMNAISKKFELGVTA